MHGVGDGAGAAFCHSAGVQHRAGAFAGAARTCVYGFQRAVHIRGADRHLGQEKWLGKFEQRG